MAEPVFVARETELHRLQTFLDQAQFGQSQVCFVAGDAGAGKSALLTEFARHAQVDEDDLLVAVGECNAQTGLGDPFLPFREILAELTGDTDTKVAGGKITAQNAPRLSNFARVSGRALVEVAPDIIGTLIPGGLILAKAAKVGAEKAGWLEALEKKAATPSTKLDENMIFQQLANLLTALAKEQPLLLILDDLQWADQASIALLFYLSRALKDARVLIVGAYRPSDIALGRGGARHPLDTTLNEIKRYRGDVLIDLNETSENNRKAFVEALVDSEPNHLSTDFREALLAHTGGYPLFTVELLRNLQERGDIVWDEAAMSWTQPGAIVWDDLPARVEGVIEERIGRLTDNLRAILTTASVEGIQFTTQVIARVCEVAERELFKALSEELEKRHRLVQEGGEEKIGKLRLWHYRFGHVLFQKYLYDELSRGERRLLHSDVARILEELYGEQAETIAVQLARHYDEGGEDEKAVYYYQRAGEQSAAVYGNNEALQHFTRALELIPENDAAARYGLYCAREKVYNLSGERAAQLADIEALERLSEALNDDYKRAETWLRRANYHFALSDYPSALRSAEKTVAGAQVLGDRNLEAEGKRLLGDTFWRLDDQAAAQTQYEQSLVLARTLGEQRLEADCLVGLGLISYSLSRYQAAEPLFQEARAILRDLGDRVREANVLASLGSNATAMGDHTTALSYLEEALRIAREIGYRQSQALWLANLGLAATWTSQLERAQASLEEGLQIAREIGDRFGESWCLAVLGNVARSQGNYSQSIEYAEEAIRLGRDFGEPGRDSLWLNFAIFIRAQAYAKVGDYARAHVEIDKVLQYYRATRQQERECWAVCLSALVNLNEGHAEVAQEQAVTGLNLAEAVGNRDMQQFGWSILGHALLVQERLDEAADSYRRALVLQRELHQIRNVAEGLAGLA